MLIQIYTLDNDILLSFSIKWSLDFVSPDAHIKSIKGYNYTETKTQAYVQMEEN